MSARLAGYRLSLALATFLPEPATALQVAPDGAPREGRVPIGETSLYVREVGCGLPVIVLHGGPDFDHRYLLPELDRLADSLHLIYYDQRGRGRSGDRVEPDEVTLASDVEDIERLRRHLHLESAALLGHSWGTVLALEYALRHPSAVECPRARAQRAGRLLPTHARRPIGAMEAVYR